MWWYSKFNHDRSKQTKVKMKDPSLHQTIYHELATKPSSYIHTSYTSRFYSRILKHKRQNGNMETFNYDEDEVDEEIDDAARQIYVELILPNRMVISNMKYLNGECILHHICQQKKLYRSQQVLCQIMDTLPTLIKIRDDSGNYPLHVACRVENRMCENVLVHMLDKFPEAVKVCNCDKQYPLHIVCANGGISEKNVERVMDIYPKAVEECNCYGQYPLHELCLSKHVSTNLIIKIINLFPKAVQVCDSYSQYPLEMYLRELEEYTKPEEKVQTEALALKMAEICPQALEGDPHEKEWCPIDMALHCCFSESTIAKLLELFPDNPINVESGVHTLITAILSNFYSDEFLFQLMDKFPYSRSYLGVYGNSPLHYAIDHNQSDAVLLRLIEAYPNDVKDHGGASNTLPLLGALKKGRSEKIVIKMIDAFSNILTSFEDYDDYLQEMVDFAKNTSYSDAVYTKLKQLISVKRLKNKQIRRRINI